jgi:hypothetical protein
LGKPGRKSSGGLYIRSWPDPKRQPKFEDPKIIRRFKLAKKLMEE